MKDQRWGYPAKGSYLCIKKHRKPWQFSGEPMSVLRVPGHSEENEWVRCHHQQEDTK